MKNITFFSLMVVAMFSFKSIAQNTLTGKVYDKDNKEALFGASIVITGTSIGVLANEEGAFTLTSQQTIDSVTIKSMGYKTQTLPVVQGKPLMVSLHSSSVNMQEVVVTANREATLRSGVPVAINKLSTEIIDDSKATLVAELVNKIPGVVIANYNNEQHGMSIRQPMGTSAYFLYMEDGLPIRPMGVFNHNALIETNLFAISSIEVVKGPASSLYGPEAVGGAMNFITQKPTAVTTAKIGLQGNNFGYKRVQYAAGGMVTKKFGVYVGGFYSDQTNGWQSFSDFTKNSINVRLDFNLSAKTKLFATTAFNDYYSQTGGSVDSLAFYTRQYTSAAAFTYRKVNSLRSRLTLEHGWNEKNQTSITAFYRNGAIGQNPSYAIRWKSPNTTATGEINESSFQSFGLQAQHSTSFKFLKSKLIGGVYLDFSPTEYDSYQIELAAKLRPDGKSVEEYTIIQERPDIKLADYDADILNTAGYMQFTFEPINKMKITAGARYDNMSFQYNNYLDTSAGSKGFGQLTGKIGATYDFGKGKGIFVNYSQGFSPPSLSAIFRKKSGTPVGEPAEFYYNLTSAQFDNYEIGGWASLWNNKVYVDATFYTMYGKNELLNIRQPDNSFDYQSAGKTFHQGIELGVSAKPKSSLLLRVGGAYSVHRYEDFVLSTKATETFKDASGKTMPSAPSWIANSEITFKPEKFMKGFRIGLEWQRISSWYLNQANTVKYDDKTFLGLEGVSVLNFRTGYKWKGIELFLNIMNLTDELYANSATRGNNPNDRTSFNPAAPRTFVFGIQYNFTGKK